MASDAVFGPGGQIMCRLMRDGFDGALQSFMADQTSSHVANLQLLGVVDSLLDKRPPFAAGIGAFGATNGFGGTNATFFDTLGRMYRVGVRMTF